MCGLWLRGGDRQQRSDDGDGDDAHEEDTDKRETETEGVDTFVSFFSISSFLYLFRSFP
jgi:hypothetical protein